VLVASGVFAAIRGQWAGLRRLVAWDAFLLFVVVGGAWYVVVCLREPGVWRYFLVDEVVNRVATDKMHRNAEWYGALKVYGPTLILGTLPWLPFAIYQALKARRRGIATEARNDGRLWLACWILLPLAIFVLARSRLPLYLLPLFAPLAIAMARALAPLNARPPWRVLALCGWALLIVASRIVPAHLDLEDDDRALAKALRDEAPVVPNEVAFVEVEPRFGLRFYLNSEVERLDLPGEPPNNRAQDIRSEMLETEGCRLLLAPTHRVTQLQTFLSDHSIAYRRLPDAHGFAVFAQSTPDCAAYAAPSSG
jgi:4-amino-4-deoxy-L-arabinose transferase